jgi:UDP-3-O-[3-hydroxymyristoyl] glucosamine N-acyltransferase
VVTHTVRQLAELVSGQVVGEGTTLIEAARPLSEAGRGHITFLEDDRHLKQLAASAASAVIMKPGHAPNGHVLIEVNDPLAAFLTVFQHLHGQPASPPLGIDRRAVVAESARIGSEPSIHPGVCIGDGTVIGERCRILPGVVIGRNCRLGDDVVLHPNVVLYDGCTLGHRVIIHANAVIGKPGFGYRQQQGRHVHVPQLGSVEIGDDVEIGACSTVDRGTFQATRIGAGTKIDNQVQIAHNCRIGKHNLLISQVGIAGSSSTGDYVVLAGQVGVVDHVQIGDGVVVGGQSAVISDVPAGARVLGTPCRPERETKVIALSLDKIPEMRRDLRRIKAHLGMSNE